MPPSDVLQIQSGNVDQKSPKPQKWFENTMIWIIAGAGFGGFQPLPVVLSPYGLIAVALSNDKNCLMFCIQVDLCLLAPLS